MPDANDATVATRTTVANPASCTVTPGALTFTEQLAALSLANGCYTLQVTDTEGTTLTSQEIRQGAHPDTLVLSGCNTSDSAGISFEGSMFRPTLRVRAVLSRPRFTFDFGDTRFSNGERERHYAKRERVQTLRIERIGEPEAEALAAMALWDRFYIGQVEHVITSDELAQDTADLWELVGGVTLDVAPRVDPAVKIRTTAEVATCTPPPNYLVEGTGPNDNYVYQENGDRFLLNN